MIIHGLERKTFRDQGESEATIRNLSVSEFKQKLNWHYSFWYWIESCLKGGKGVGWYGWNKCKEVEIMKGEKGPRSFFCFYEIEFCNFAPIIQRLVL